MFWILDNQQVLGALGGAPTQEGAEGAGTAPASEPAPIP
jgi:hypothetical protein